MRNNLLYPLWHLCTRETIHAIRKSDTFRKHLVDFCFTDEFYSRIQETVSLTYLTYLLQSSVSFLNLFKFSYSAFLEMEILILSHKIPRQRPIAANLQLHHDYVITSNFYPFITSF